jgi:hypothetical protein
MTDYMPGFEDQLLQAARRRRRRALVTRLVGALPRGRTGALALAGALLVAGGATAAMLTRGEVGGPPTRPMPPVAGERLERQSEPTVLGSGRLPSGTRFELVGYRYRPASAGASLLCIDLVVLPQGQASGCGDELVRGDGDIEVAGRGSFALPTQPEPQTMVTGTTSDRVASVAILYRDDGERVTRSVAHFRITSPALLRRVGVAEPFGYYVAELPADATDARLVARDADGTVIDRVEDAFQLGG